MATGAGLAGVFPRHPSAAVAVAIIYIRNTRVQLASVTDCTRGRDECTLAGYKLSSRNEWRRSNAYHSVANGRADTRAH